jgi:putative aldouronate transport system permease protein
MPDKSFSLKKLATYWQLYLFLLLPLASVLLFSYLPMAGIQLAFKKYDFRGGIWGSPWVGLAHFKRFLSSYQFWRTTTNTLRISVYSIIAGFPFPIIFAVALNSLTNARFKKAVQTITYIPHFISTVVLVGMILQMFHNTVGIYGTIGRALTGNKPPDIFASASSFLHLYVWSGVWKGFGWNSIIYLAVLTNVSPELLEAAEIDGANRFQRAIYIDYPTLVPTIVIQLILRLGDLLSVGFEKVFLMQNDLNLRYSEIITTYVYKQGIGGGSAADYSYATAIGLFNSVISLVLIIIVNKVARTYGETSLW